MVTKRQVTERQVAKQLMTTVTFIMFRERSLSPRHFWPQVPIETVFQPAAAATSQVCCSLLSIGKGVADKEGYSFSCTFDYEFYYGLAAACRWTQP
jgi:hypothetical protein